MLWTTLLKWLVHIRPILNFHPWVKKNVTPATTLSVNLKSFQTKSLILTWEVHYGKKKKSQPRWVSVIQCQASTLQGAVRPKKFLQKSAIPIINCLWRVRRSKLMKRLCEHIWQRPYKGNRHQSHSMSSTRKDYLSWILVMVRKTQMLEGW